MGLKIYDTPAPTNGFSVDAAMTNPLRLAFDGRLGEIISRRLFLRNDDNTYQYSLITVQPVDTGGDSIIDGSDGYSWKLKVGTTEPLDEEWATITAGSSISFTDISDITTYLPFWIRIEVPRGAPINLHDDVILRINATEVLTP